MDEFRAELESAIVRKIEAGDKSAHLLYALHEDYGWTYERIGALLDITKQGVKWRVNKYYTTVRQTVNRYMEAFDGLGGDHSAAYMCRLVRWHLSVRVEPDYLNQGQLDRLWTLYRRLRDEDLVVEYDPSIPYHEGDKYGGWRYTEREESDGDLLVRENDDTTIKPEDRWIWTFPENL